MQEELEKDMTPKLVGEPYLRKATPNSSQRSWFAMYECQYCGKEWEAVTRSIKTGNTKSCGCQNYVRTHGVSNHKFAGTWYNMNKRCNNPEDKDYPSYGGRGINICDEWLDIKVFVSWCDATFPNLKGYTLDRIDNDKGYNPDNCRWVDKTTQFFNKRILKKSKSGYVGIRYHTKDKRWHATLIYQGKHKFIGGFILIEDAILARDQYIIDNNLPHTLNILKREKNK